MAPALPTTDDNSAVDRDSSPCRSTFTHVLPPADGPPPADNLLPAAGPAPAASPAPADGPALADKSLPAQLPTTAEEGSAFDELVAEYLLAAEGGETGPDEVWIARAEGEAERMRSFLRDHVGLRARLRAAGEASERVQLDGPSALTLSMTRAGGGEM